MPFGLHPKLALALPAITGAVMLLLTQPAHAQQDAPKADAGMARAQKAADAVFHWIKLNADKGANRQAPAPAPAARKPATTPLTAAPKPTTATPVPQQPTAPTSVVATPAADQEPEPVLLASAAPTPTPVSPPAVVAMQATAEPPTPPAEDPEEPLKLLVKVEPAFPRQLLQQRMQRGFAQVQFTVAPDGSVSQAQSVSASHARLGSAAVDAIRQWRFAPITKERTMAIEVAFTNNTE